MHILITIVHITVCIAMILVVLLQTGKGADMGAAFGGGGSQTLFGSSGPSNFLSKGTTVVAVVFMLTSLTLAIPGRSVVEQVKAPTAVTQEIPEEAPAQSAPVATPTAEDAQKAASSAPVEAATESGVTEDAQ